MNFKNVDINIHVLKGTFCVLIVQSFEAVNLHSPPRRLKEYINIVHKANIR